MQESLAVFFVSPKEVLVVIFVTVIVVLVVMARRNIHLAQKKTHIVKRHGSHKKRKINITRAILGLILVLVGVAVHFKPATSASWFISIALWILGLGLILGGILHHPIRQHLIRPARQFTSRIHLPFGKNTREDRKAQEDS